MEYFLFWLAFSAVVGAAASSRGRSFVGWMLISAVITPLLGLILVLVIPARNQPGRTGHASDAEAVTDNTHRRCPACAEPVRREAMMCKHCGHAIIVDDVRNNLDETAGTDGLVEVRIVGESSYQDALRLIAETHASLSTNRLLTAKLVAEPDNRQDPHAVRVEVAGRTVGYLPRSVAKLYRPAVRSHFKLTGPVPPVTVPAVSRGSERNYGLFLYLAPDLAARMINR